MQIYTYTFISTVGIIWKDFQSKWKSNRPQTVRTEVFSTKSTWSMFFCGEMAVICHKISVKCRWNHGETFTTKIYKLGPKCRWNILIVGDNTTAKIICSLHANFFRPEQVTLLAYLSEPYFTSPKSASFFSIALLCLSLTSWYFIPSCLIMALPFTKTESFSVTQSSWHAVCPQVFSSGGASKFLGVQCTL